MCVRNWVVGAYLSSTLDVLGVAADEGGLLLLLLVGGGHLVWFGWFTDEDLGSGWIDLRGLAVVWKYEEIGYVGVGCF